MNKEKYLKKMKKTGEVSIEETVFLILENYITEQSLAEFRNDLVEYLGTDANEYYTDAVIKETVEDCKKYAKRKKPMKWKEEIKKGLGR